MRNYVIAGDVFVDWLFHFPLLAAIVGLLVWIVVFDGLNGMGLPDVFWRQTRNASILGGAGVAMVFSIAIFVGFLVNVDHYVKARGAGLFDYSVWIDPVLTVLVVVGFVRKMGKPGTHPYAFLLSYLVTASGLGAAARWLQNFASSDSVAAFWIAHPFLKDILIPRAQPDTIEWHTYAIFVAAIASAAYFLFASPLLYKRIVSSFAICILLTVALLAYGWSTFNFGGWKVILLYAFAVLLLLSDALVPRRYRYPTLRKLYDDDPVPLSTQRDRSHLIRVEDSLDAWRAQFGEKNPKLLIVATSGGGIRAAAWTSAVLTNLVAQMKGEFERHVRIVTGASGGLVGAADWVARLYTGKNPGAGATSIASNALDDVARALAMRDITKLFLPVTWHDRGVALEERWLDAAAPMGVTFAQFCRVERTGVLPSLIFSPMFVEDGRRLLISNLDLTALTRADGPQLPDATAHYSTRAVQMFELFPSARTTMPLATAARMNASFPYVAPAAELPTEPRRHIVDAGYYDNFGISTATAFIAQYAEWLTRNTSGVAIIEIRDSSLQTNRQSPAFPKGGGIASAFAELVAPPIGAISSALTVQGYHNDNDEQRVAERFGLGFFTRVLFEYPDSAPLSWSLTREELQHINRGARTCVEKQAPALAAWLK